MYSISSNLCKKYYALLLIFLEYDLNFLVMQKQSKLLFNCKIDFFYMSAHNTSLPQPTSNLHRTSKKKKLQFF